MADKPVSETGLSDFNRDLLTNTKRLERLSKAADKASDSIKNLEAAYNKLADLAREPIKFKIHTRGGKGSQVSQEPSDTGSQGSSSEDKKDKKNNKNTKEFFKIITSFSKDLSKGNISRAATTAFSAYDKLGAVVTKAGLACGATIAALTLLSKVTLDARKNTSAYVKSLQTMGIQLNNFEKSNIDTSNQLNDLSNRVSNLTQGLGELLAPFLDFLVDVADLATAFLPDEEPKVKQLGAQADIVADARQSGFNLSSAQALGGGTYRAALGMAGVYREQASEIAKKLADAWTTGSDAAKEYGIVLNDNVLTGYLWSEGIDIANVQITDAMKQYYRYQLMLKQTSGEVSQDMIKDWTSLGFIIDKTKNKLFSFDEVIQLAAVDPRIPEVEGSAYLNEDRGTPVSPVPPIVPPVIPPVVPPMNSTSSAGVAPGLTVPVFYDVPEDIPLPVPSPIPVPVYFNVPSLPPIPHLEPVVLPVNIPVAVPGLEDIPVLQGLLDNIPSYVPVGIPVMIPGLSLANQLLQYCERLSLTDWITAVSFTIPGLYLAPIALDYLVDIAKNWMANVNLKVVGLELLNRAEQLLNRITNQLKALGQNIKTGATTTYSKVKAGVANTKSNILSTSSALSKGFSGEKDSNLINKWAPVSSEAYRGGLLGAFKADLDLNLTRSGLKSTTAEGYTTRQLNEATAGYLGYQLNPLNKSGAANIIAKGAAGSAIAAGGYGLLGKVVQGGTYALDALGGFIEGLGQLTPAMGLAFADGGIGTHEIHNATLFENNKKEAVIPLETSAGIDYLANAMNKAGMEGETGGDIIINLTLSGINLADNDAAWERVGRKIGEVIDVQRQRRGELNYGSSF